MNGKVLIVRTGAAVMGMAVLWSFLAPWLSANNKILVYTEGTGYVTALEVLLFGGLLYLYTHYANWPARRPGWLTLP